MPNHLISIDLLIGNQLSNSYQQFDNYVCS